MIKKGLIIVLLYCSNFLIGQSFYLCTDKKNLALANVDHCSYQVLCSTSPLTLYDIALTPGGILYGTDGKTIYRVDPVNCNYTPATDSVITGFGDLTSLIALNDSILIAASDSRLFKIELNSGNSSMIGWMWQIINGQNVYHKSAGDLVYYQGQLYLSTFGDYGKGLLQIELASDNNSISHLNFIGEMNADYQLVMGMAIVTDETCSSGKGKMLAFAGISAYSVDPSNAAVQKLCTWGINNWMVDNATYGAAHIPVIEDKKYTTEYELPNVFTPNGDNVNDFFSPVKTKYVLESEITIYDRWGKTVYHSNELNFSWDGLNLQKEKSSDGNYFYTSIIKTSCDETIKSHGFITLLR